YGALLFGTCLMAISSSVYASADITGRSGFNLKYTNTASVNTEHWRCQYCPEMAGQRGNLGVVAQYADRGEGGIRQASGQSDGLRGYIDASVQQPIADDAQVSGMLQQFPLDNRQARLAYQQTDFNAELQTNASSYRGSYQGGRTQFSTRSNAELDPLETDTPVQFEPNLERERVRVKIRGTVLEDRLALYAEYDEQQRDGQRFTDGSILNDVVALPRVRDDVLKQWRLGADVPFHWDNGLSGSVFLEWFLSHYDNHRQSLVWQNPYAGGDSWGYQGRLAEDPDNTFDEWRLGGMLFWGSQRLQWRYAQGTGTQDEAYLPYAISGANVSGDTVPGNTVSEDLAINALPAIHHDGEIDTRQIDLLWTLPLRSDLELKSGYHLRERDDQSAILTFTPYLTDSPYQSIDTNQPLSYKQNRYSVQLGWRLYAGHRAVATYMLEDYLREFRDSLSQENVEAQTHNLSIKWFAKWNQSIKTVLNISQSDRDRERSQGSDASDVNTLVQDMYLASRSRNALNLSATYVVTPSFLLSSDWRWQRDDYIGAGLGLADAENRSVNVGLQWSCIDGLTARLSTQLDDFEWQQVGGSASSNWFAVQDDQYITMMLGAVYDRLLDERLKVGLDYVLSTAFGKDRYADKSYDYRESRSHNHFVKAFAQYQFRPRWQLELAAAFERIREQDTQVDALDTIALSNVIESGLRPRNDRGWILATGLRYHF
ncbi:MAG: MtrB/PioB family outer membrane beta-barrel protein, partial [Pseudomonadales bacterium]|nr:MtrB/PioB family outer membrane beta-barrel protein [Pseudomonadales bacterium]